MSSDLSALPAAPLAPVKRRWFRISLRSFVLGIIVLCTTLAWIAKEQRQTAFEQDFAKIAYETHFGGPFDSAERTASHRRQGWWRDQARWLLGERIVSIDSGSIGGNDGFFLNGYTQMDPQEVVGTLPRLTNLQKLHLHIYPSTDLSPLARLTDLRELTLSGLLGNEGVFLSRRQAYLHTIKINDWRRESVDISLVPFAQLNNLETLEIESAARYDLRPLSRMQNLRNLSLHFLGAHDLSPLADLPKLQRLRISGDGVDDLSPLAKLSSLRRLDLWCMNVRDVWPLRKLTNLEYLELSRTSVRQADINELQAALRSCTVVGRTP